MDVRERLGLGGRVEIFVTQGRPVNVIPIDRIRNDFGLTVYRDAELDFSKTNLIHTEDIKNIILNTGKDRVITSLTTGFVRTIARMAVGDRGAIPSDQTIPKVPVSSMTGLYNEVFRSDVEVVTQNIGTPSIHEVKFIKTFSALTIPITSFSNQANPIINEVSLIMCDLLSGSPLPRLDIAAPSAPNTDEENYSIRCFKSVPFEAANEISITFRYTVFIA